MIKFAVGGIAVTDETMAIDDIAKVGAFGDFLSLDATLKHMRELSQPTVLDRRVREDWESRGATDLASRSRARALELVESHQPRRSTPTWPSRCAASSKLPTVRKAWHERPAQASHHRRQRGRRHGHDPGAARHRRQRPGDPRRGPAPRHGGGRARACARASASSPRCCSPPGSCRPASTSCARTWPPATRPAWARVVIGTVEGDLHDIGKNLVGMLLQGAGFTVVNLGTGVTAADFVAAVKEHAPADHRHERPAHHHPAAHERDHRAAQGRRPARVASR